MERIINLFEYTSNLIKGRPGHQGSQGNRAPTRPWGVAGGAEGPSLGEAGGWGCVCPKHPASISPAGWPIVHQPESLPPACSLFRAQGAGLCNFLPDVQRQGPQPSGVTAFAAGRTQTGAARVATPRLVCHPREDCGRAPSPPWPLSMAVSLTYRRSEPSKKKTNQTRELAVGLGRPPPSRELTLLRALPTLPLQGLDSRVGYQPGPWRGVARI